MRLLPRIAVVGLCSLAIGHASLRAQTVKLTGQVRPRLEVRAPDGHADGSTTMRTRVGVSAGVTKEVSVVMQLQDVRTWGQEPSTMVDSGVISLHQAYIDVGAATRPVAARIGRQEVVFGEERLIGAADWVQQARAFDGVRGKMQSGRLAADAFAFQVADPSIRGRSTDDRFLGAYAAYAWKPAAFEAYVLHNRSGGLTPTRQTTTGFRAVHTGIVGYRIEAAVQRGVRKDRDVDAYLFAGALSAKFMKGRAQLTAWYDLLSGDDTPADSTIRVFDTVYGTNHKFYGIADMFTNIPLHTSGRGLQDIALKSTFAVSPAFSVAADAHAFRVASDGGLEQNRLGEELDVTGTWRHASGIALNGGVAAFQAAPLMKTLQLPGRNQIFTYMMVTVGF